MAHQIFRILFKIMNLTDFHRNNLNNDSRNMFPQTPTSPFCYLPLPPPHTINDDYCPFFLLSKTRPRVRSVHPSL